MSRDLRLSTVGSFFPSNLTISPTLTDSEPSHPSKPCRKVLLSRNRFLSSYFSFALSAPCSLRTLRLCPLFFQRFLPNTMTNPLVHPSFFPSVFASLAKNR